MSMNASIEERLARVEAQLAIQQLPIRYAIGVDSRDLDALVALFVEDVDCGRRGRGRAALKDYYAADAVLKGFYRSVHQICGHAIDLIDADNATGKVYCRAEHEDNGHWVVMAICYFDTYQRRGDSWYFVRREEQHWYSSDWLERPGAPRFQNWPGKYTSERYQPRLPQAFPTWAPFWSGVDPEQLRKLTGAP